MNLFPKINIAVLFLLIILTHAETIATDNQLNASPNIKDFSTEELDRLLN